MGDETPHPEKRKNKSALERARDDLAAGRPDLARDRITGYLYTLHRRGEYCQAAYLLLGEIYFAMHDLPRAGAAWLLTERQGDDVDRAVAAFHERYGRASVNVLKVLKPHAPSEDYPPAVQDRLKAWEYRYRHYRPRANPHAAHELVPGEEQRGLRGIEIGCMLAAVVVGLTVVLWIYMSFFSRH